MKDGKFEIRWLDRGRPPRVPPSPQFPEGKDVNLTLPGEPGCTVQLPYPCPHPNVGAWMVRCLTCGTTVMITAASRPDDARSARIPCRGRMQ